MKNFSVQQVLGNSWKLFQEHWQVLLLAGAIETIFGLVGVALGSTIDRSAPLVALLIQLVFLVIQIGLSVGVVKIALEIVDGRKPQISEMWTNFSYAPNYILMSIVMIVIVGLGLVLLVLPGLYLLIRLQLAPYFLIDKKVSAFDALSMSWKNTKENFWNLLAFDLVIFVVYFVIALIFAIIGGVLSSFVPMASTIFTSIGGLLVSGVLALAVAMVYRKLSNT